MLQLPEMNTTDRLSTGADSASAAAARNKDATDQTRRGFAGVLSAAAPAGSAQQSARGDKLPGNGKNLPATADGAATASAETTDLAAADLLADQLPGMDSGLLLGGIPSTQAEQSTPLLAASVNGSSSDAELAALQMMLPPQNQTVTTAETEIGAAERAPVPATAPIVGDELMAQDKDAFSGLEAGPGAQLRRYVSLPFGALTTDRAGQASIVRGDATQPALAPLQSVPGDMGAAMGDAANGSAESALKASLLAGDVKQFADQLRAVSETRTEALDGLPRAQPLGAPSLPGNGPVPAAPNPGIAAINVPVMDTRWGEALGERVMWATGQKLDSAEIRLNPAELGPVKIKIKLDDQQVHVTFTAHHAVTRDAIEQALPRLRDLFSGEGLNLANADVNGEGVHHENDGGSESGQNDAGGRHGLLAGAETDEQVPLPAIRVGNGLVDTFA